MDQRGQPLRHATRRDDVHPLGGESVYLPSHGDDVLVVGQQDDRLGGDLFHHLQQLASGGVHALTTGHHSLGSQPPKALAETGTRHHGHHSHLGGGELRQRIELRPVMEALRPRLFQQVGDLDLEGPAYGLPFLVPQGTFDRSRRIVGVDVAVPYSLAAHHDDRVADLTPSATKGVDEIIFRLQEEHDLVAQRGDIARHRLRGRLRPGEDRRRSEDLLRKVYLAVAHFLEEGGE